MKEKLTRTWTYRNTFFLHILHKQNAYMPLFPIKSAKVCSTDTAQAHTASLWTTEFTLLFILSMFANTYIAVFYSFEYWLVQKDINPHWRGILLAAMGFAVLSARPLISVWLLRHKGILLMAIALAMNSCIMICYSFANSPELILCLRILQGIGFASMHSAAVTILVACIPDGQSARGFSFFSLTMLLPYSIIPGISEHILPFLQNESQLYAYTALLSIPSFCAIYLLSRRIKNQEAPNKNKNYTLRVLWKNALNPSLIPLFLASWLFGCGIVTVVFFIKSLCIQNDTAPGTFFILYTAMIILVRIIANNKLDSIPRTPGIIICSIAISLILIGIALGPSWLILPLAPLYGICVGFLYPMIAANIYDLSSQESRPINSNIMMLTYDASYVFTPLLGGLLLEQYQTYTGVFLMGAGYIALIVPCMYFFSVYTSQKSNTL